jgi:hypothetical protein
MRARIRSTSLPALIAVTWAEAASTQHRQKSTTKRFAFTGLPLYMKKEGKCPPEELRFLHLAWC